MAKLIHTGILRKRDNLVRDWHSHKVNLFENGILQFWAGPHFDQPAGEYALHKVDKMYFSDKNSQCLVLVDDDLLYGWKLKVKAPNGELLKLVRQFIKFTTNISAKERAFWQRKVKEFETTKCNANALSTYKKLLDIPDGKDCNNKLPEFLKICELRSELDVIVLRISSNANKVQCSDKEKSQMQALQKGIKVFVTSYLERYIQLFKKESDMDFLSALIDLLQLGCEIDALQSGHLSKDEKLNKIINSMDCILVTGIEKSIKRFTTEYIDTNTKSCGEAILTLEKVHIVLKLHEDHFENLFEEFFFDFRLFAYIGNCVLHSVSLMVGNLVDNFDETHIASIHKLVDLYRQMCSTLVLVYNNYNYTETQAEVHAVHAVESETLELFINYEIKRLSNNNTLGLIENALENTIWDMDKSHFDKETNLYFTNSVFDSFNIISPIITKLMSFPVQKYQIIQIIELFSSFIAHFGIILLEKISIYLEGNCNATLPMSSAKLFLMVGDFHRLQKRTVKYLQSKRFCVIFKQSINTKKAELSIKNQKLQSITSKLRGKTIFAIIEEMLNEIAPKIAKTLCQHFASNIYALIWNAKDYNIDIEEKLDMMVLKHISFEFEQFQNYSIKTFCKEFHFETYRWLLNILVNTLNNPPNNEFHHSIVIIMTAKRYVTILIKHMNIHKCDVEKIKNTEEYKESITIIEQHFIQLSREQTKHPHPDSRRILNQNILFT